MSDGYHDIKQTMTEGEPQRHPCRWTQDEDGIWDTECGDAFEFSNDGPKENHMRFCPYCGRPLQEAVEGAEK